MRLRNTQWSQVVVLSATSLQHSIIYNIVESKHKESDSRFQTTYMFTVAWYMNVNNLKTGAAVQCNCFVLLNIFTTFFVNYTVLHISSNRNPSGVTIFSPTTTTTTTVSCTTTATTTTTFSKLSRILILYKYQWHLLLQLPMVIIHNRYY